MKNRHLIFRQHIVKEIGMLNRIGDRPNSKYPVFYVDSKKEYRLAKNKTYMCNMLFEAYILSVSSDRQQNV
jgi:hypothetical protein